MKITGIILIGFQLLAYMSGNFEMSYSTAGNAIGYLLGYNAIGIIGIIVLIRASNQETKKKDAENEKNKSN